MIHCNPVRIDYIWELGTNINPTKSNNVCYMLHMWLANRKAPRSVIDWLGLDLTDVPSQVFVVQEVLY